MTVDRANVRTLRTTDPPCGADFHSVISICLDAIRITWLASDLQQMSTWSKLSLAGYTCSSPFISRLMLKCQLWLCGSLVCTICNVHIQFMASQCYQLLWNFPARFHVSLSCLPRTWCKLVVSSYQLFNGPVMWFVSLSVYHCPFCWSAITIFCAIVYSAVCWINVDHLHCTLF